MEITPLTSQFPPGAREEAMSIAMASDDNTDCHDLSYSTSAHITRSPSKRRWNPCTWRYAIEDLQPDLGSCRPRSHGHGVSRNVHVSAPRCRKNCNLRRKPYRPCPGAGGFEEDESDDHGAKLSRLDDDTEASGHGMKQKFAKECESVKDDVCEDDRNQNVVDKQKDKLCRMTDRERHGCEAESGSDDYSRVDLVKTKLDRRCWREMSPAELYFCQICADNASCKQGLHSHES